MRQNRIDNSLMFRVNSKPRVKREMINERESVLRKSNFKFDVVEQRDRTKCFNAVERLLKYQPR